MAGITNPCAMNIFTVCGAANRQLMTGLTDWAGVRQVLKLLI